MSYLNARAAAEWSALADALRNATAACEGDASFVAEPADLPAGYDTALSAVCGGCPVLTACGLYSRRARPSGGFWAGRRYPDPRYQRGTPRTPAGDRQRATGQQATISQESP